RKRLTRATGPADDGEYVARLSAARAGKKLSGYISPGTLTGSRRKRLTRATTVQATGVAASGSPDRRNAPPPGECVIR
ncbi:hypothetical protein, partial [Klebsiella michiganensis]|uniref:hypothetical protein n=1 Tax=Klebsiella michiganensis TaxID=1134687 RepID=UPI001C498C4C